MPSGFAQPATMLRGLEPADHHDLQQRVEHRADRHGRENRPGQILFRVARFTGELDGLLEALQREHDAAGQRGEHAMEAERHEAAAGVEVGRR